MSREFKSLKNGILTHSRCLFLQPQKKQDDQTKANPKQNGRTIYMLVKNVNNLTREVYLTPKGIIPGSYLVHTYSLVQLWCI